MNPRMSGLKNDGKVVLVTGCSEGGIGYALAKQYAARGAKVYATARRTEAMESLRGLPGMADLLVLDVTSKQDRERVVAQIVKKEGRIDVLVNNAGYGSVSTALLDADLDEARRLFDTNFWGAVGMMQLVGQQMAAQRSGHIQNMGSLSSYTIAPLAGFYAASKAALEKVTHVMRQEMALLGVKVTYVAPGFVATRITQQAQMQESLQEAAWGGSVLAPYYRVYIAAVHQLLRDIRLGMPLEAFARQYVGAMEARGGPPLVWRAGALSWMYYTAMAFPLALQDWLNARLTGTYRVKLPPLADGKKTA